VYLWAFPVQQGILALGIRLPIAVDILVVTVISAGFALISWHLVESPSLKLKTSIRRAVDARGERREQRRSSSVALPAPGAVSEN